MLAHVPAREIVMRAVALVLIVDRNYLDVIPYPTSGPAQWFPVVAFGWVLLVALVAFLVPGFAQRLSSGLRQLDEESEPGVRGG